MTGADLAAVHHAVAVRLRALTPRAGNSSRVTALAVALERLGYADDLARARAAEVHDRVPRLQDLANALVRWRAVDGALAPLDLDALQYAALELNLAALEAGWSQLQEGA